MDRKPVDHDSLYFSWLCVHELGASFKNHIAKPYNVAELHHVLGRLKVLRAAECASWKCCWIVCKASRRCLARVQHNWRINFECGYDRGMLRRIYLRSVYQM